MMDYLLWKQHRKQFILFGVFLLLFALIAIPSGLNFWHTYQHALAGCSKIGTCSQLSNGLFKSSTDGDLFHLMQLTILAVPVLLGLFWGAPLIAKEYAEGSNKLIWMQGMSRRKWLTVKLLWVIGAAVVCAGAFAALATWWSRTGNALYLDRFDTLNFSAQGIVPVAYAVFAVALGVALGAWFRRTMVALGVTLAFSIAIVLVAIPNFARPHYMTPVTVTASMTRGELESKLPSGAWVVSKDFVDPHGRVSSSPFNNWPPQCQALVQTQQTQVAGYKQPASPVAISNCLTSAGYRQIAKYQPSYRYWDFQRIEAGLYLALSILPIGATYWLVLKRDA
jgi:hypothetical protein